MSYAGRILLLASIWLASACSGLGYTGSARDLASDALERERGWVAVHGVPLYRQDGDHDCGPTALAMVLRYWDHDLPVDALLHPPLERRASGNELRELARDAGFQAFVIEGSVEDLVHEIKTGRPAIVGVAKPSVKGRVAHYEVVVGFHPATRRIATLDPAEGFRQNDYAGFLDEWLSTGSVLIVVIPRAAVPIAANAR